MAETKTAEVQQTTFEGGCHCGRVRFKCVVLGPLEALDCNCSMCLKKGIIHLIVPPERFTLLKGTEALSTYTFNTHVAKHHFCTTCGIQPFYRPRSHPTDYDVNVRCLDGDVSGLFKITKFDGANWEKNVSQIVAADSPVLTQLATAQQAGSVSPATATTPGASSSASSAPSSPSGITSASDG